MTFTTNPGHLLYPGSITFASSTASASAINFNISLAGRFPSATRRTEFALGAGAFEDAQWKHFLSQVQGFCQAGK
jgi:hypothetical protein